MNDDLKIGDIKLENKLILAPMAGMLRLSLRMAYRRLGCAMTCIGVVDARAVAQSNSDDLVTILGRTEYTNKEERPVCVQLIGMNPPQMAEAAQRIEHHASILNLNFSGPIQSIVDAGYGAGGLLSQPHLINEIVRKVVRSVSIPVTVKIRIGHKGDDVDVLRIALGCQDAGAEAIVIHARTISEMYNGPVHWEWIQKVKEAVRIPVVGNGGIRTPEDAAAMLEQTGCDFVMLGKTPFINPLIFLQTNQYLETGSCLHKSNVSTLMNFFYHYWQTSSRIDSSNPLRFYKRRCRAFLKMRHFIQKLENGSASLNWRNPKG